MRREDALSFYLGLCRYGDLRRGADESAVTRRGEAGGRAQRVLHLHRGRGRLTHSRHQLDGGQDSRGRGLEGDQVVQVLTRQRVQEGHLVRGVRGLTGDNT